MYMHETTSHEAPCVCTSVRKASRVLTRAYDNALEPAAISAGQLALLRAIERGGADGVPLSRLAEAMMMDATSLYRALAPLKRDEVVNVSASRTGRAKIVALTDLGRRTADKSAPYWENAQRKMIDAFGADRWKRAHADIAELTAIAARLQRSGSAQ